MCLNQVDHVFEPSFFIWCYVFQENEVDHVFEPGLLLPTTTRRGLNT